MGTSKTVAVHPTDGDTGRQRREELLACLEAYDERFATVEMESFITPEPSDADIPLMFVDVDGEWLLLELVERADYEMDLTLGDLLGAVVDDAAFDWAVYGTDVPEGPPSPADVGPVVAIGGAQLERIGRQQLLTAPAYAAFERPNSVSLVTSLGGAGWSREAVEAFLTEPTADDTESGTPAVLDTVPEIGLDPIALLEAVGDWPRDHVQHLQEYASDENDRLLALLEDERASVRREAAWAIAQPFRTEVDVESCIEPLTAVIRDIDDPEVRQLALEGISDIARYDNGFDPETCVEPIVTVAKETATATLRQTTIEVAADLARTGEDPDVADTVAVAIETDVLADPRPDVRKTGIEALSDVVHATTEKERFLGIFRDIYETDDDPKVCAEALQKAVIYADDIGLLFDGLESEVSVIRARAAQILGKFALWLPGYGSIEWMPVIRAHDSTIHRALTSEDDAVRAAAMKALRLVDIAVDPEILVTALRDVGNEEVQRAAAIALKYEAGKDGQLGGDPVPSLLDLLTDDRSSENLRHDVAKALGVIGDERAVNPLLEAIDEERIDREPGLEAVGEIGASAVEILCDRLLTALNDEDPVTAYATALGITADERAFEPLLTAYNSAGLQSPAYDEIGHALGCVGGELAIDPLVAALQDGRTGATRGLGAVGSPAVEPILSMLDSADLEDDAQERAVLALGRTRDSQAIHRLLYMLAGADPGLACTICEALGFSEDERLVPVLRQLSTLAVDESVRDAADDALWDLCRNIERREYAALGVPGLG